MAEAVQQASLKEGSKREKLKREKPAVYEKVIRYQEKVARGESIALIVLNYAYTCNFACEHCCAENFKPKNAGPQARSLTPKDVDNLCRQGDALGLGNIVISGGEPLTYPDFDDVVAAIDPSKWYIAFDTNAWLLDAKKAKHLKSIGVDKAQISLDSFVEEEHDRFRNRPGAYQHVMRAIDASLEAGLNVILMTTMTRDRVRSEEFHNFLEFTKSKGIGAYVTLAKPVGVWEGKFDALCGNAEIDYLNELAQQYDVFTRMSPGYGIDLGCISVKRSVTVIQSGDVMPCPYMFISLGNIFDEPFKDILERGLKIKHFAYGEKHTCLTGNKDYHFIKDYLTKTYGKKGAVPYREVFTAKDFVDGKMH
ncbi:MAG: radical SAM protein [Patescibacteria group bacterium]|nr:radical SAM protein [Patescibacteria group bacterium]